MDSIRRAYKPVLRRPKALLAFEGWNDASDCASGVLTYLIEQFGGVRPFASIDPEEFFDFQAHRPSISIGDHGSREIHWPRTEFFPIQLPSQPSDLLLVLGEEPSYRWRTYAHHITSVLAEHAVEQAVLLGGFIGQVAHTLPVPVFGSSSDQELTAGVELSKSGYEGPTGIVAILHDAIRREGTPVTSLWAANPHYLAANPNPKCSLALLHKAGEVLKANLPTTDLESQVEDYMEKVAEAVESSGDFSEYLAELEQADDSDLEPLDPTITSDLVDEIEDFLKDQGQ